MRFFSETVRLVLRCWHASGEISVSSTASPCTPTPTLILKVEFSSQRCVLILKYLTGGRGDKDK